MSNKAVTRNLLKSSVRHALTHFPDTADGRQPSLEEAMDAVLDKRSMGGTLTYHEMQVFQAAKEAIVDDELARRRSAIAAGVKHSARGLQASPSSSPTEAKPINKGSTVDRAALWRRGHQQASLLPPIRGDE